MRRSVTLPEPYDFTLTLGLLQRSYRDPTTRRPSAAEIHRASRTPEGPAAISIARDGGRARTQAWGPGAAWLLDRLPALLGLDDDPSAFAPEHPLLRELHRRMRGLRFGRTGLVMEAVIPSVIDQKVTGPEAFTSFARLVRRYGEPAPGPLGLMLQPSPEVIAGLPYWALHAMGIERKRAETLLRACAAATRLKEAGAMAPADASRRLRALRGIGAWTAAEVARVALGDPDAVSVGDYHLKNVVAYALAGEPRGTDERMLELLEPYRGHRGRAVRLIEAGGPMPPRFGPRARLRSIARI